MNVTRRKLILGGSAVAVAAAMPGCHVIPTAEQGWVIGRGVGGATGLVMDPCVTDNAVRNAIVGTVEAVSRCVPQEGETVRQAWTRIARARVQELVDAGELSLTQAAAVLAAFELVLCGWALVEERHPQVAVWGGLAVAMTGGFCEGFLAAFRPANGDAAGECTVDPTAYRALLRANEYHAFKLHVAPTRGTCP